MSLKQYPKENDQLSCNMWVIHSFIHSRTHSFTNAFIRLFIYSLIRNIAKLKGQSNTIFKYILQVREII